MKLNSMKPRKIKDRLSRAGSVGRKRRQEEAGGAPDEAKDLQPDPADLVGEQDRTDDPDDQQEVDQRGTLGRHDIVIDKVGQASHMRRLVTDGGGENRRRENPDTVGPEESSEEFNRALFVNTEDCK